MKQTLILIYFITISHCVMSQEKEWQALATALDKEVQLFIGKKGYIKLTKFSCNNFEIKDARVSQNPMFVRTFMYDRFGNIDYDILMDEFLELEQFAPWPSFCELSVLYDYDFYYEDFPKTVFIKLTTCTDSFIPRQTTTRANYFTEDEPLDTITEDEVTDVILPVRTKRLPKLLRLFNAYVQSTLKPKLDDDRTH